MQKKPLVMISLALHFTIILYGMIVFFLGNGQGWARQWVILPDLQIVFYALTVMTIMNVGLAFNFNKIFGKGKPLNFRNIDYHTQTITIIRMAMAESIAIFGLILSILNQSMVNIIPYALVALIVQYLVGPIHGAKSEESIIQ